MLRNRFSAVLLLLSLLFIATCPIAATQAAHSVNHNELTAVSVDLIQDNLFATRLTFNVDELDHQQVDINGQSFDKFSIDGELTIAQEGYPDLPCVSRMILIPPQSDVKLKTNQIKSHIIQDVNPILSANLDNSDKPVLPKIPIMHDTKVFGPPSPL